MDEAHISCAHYDSTVRAAYLSPGLLKQRNPKSAGVGVAVGNIRSIAREEVVNHDILPLSSDTHLDHVASSLVWLTDLEELLNPLWVLSESRETRDEVAVSKRALLDVLRGQVIRANGEVGAVDLRGSLPLDIHEVVLFADRSEGIQVRSEGLVGELFTSGLACLDDAEPFRVGLSAEFLH